MLKIIIPLAGTSELFSNAGYIYPKPLIEINGVPMVQIVTEKIALIKKDFQLIFIIKEEDAAKFHLDNTLRLLAPNIEVIKLKNNAKGGLCSVLMAIDGIEDDDQILILNGDQVIEYDLNVIADHWKNQYADAGVVTFKSVHPRWSYARIETDLVVQTAEKNPISHHAIAGYYFFKNALLFFECAFECIKKDVNYEGNFYISPVINEYILKDKKVLSFEIEAINYHSFYSPQMVQEYERKEINNSHANGSL